MEPNVKKLYSNIGIYIYKYLFPHLYVSIYINIYFNITYICINMHNAQTHICNNTQKQLYIFMCVHTHAT